MLSQNAEGLCITNVSVAMFFGALENILMDEFGISNQIAFEKIIMLFLCIFVYIFYVFNCF